MSLVCVHHVYWWFSTAYGIYIRSVSGNRISSQISYVMIYSGSKSSTHGTHPRCLALHKVHILSFSSMIGFIHLPLSIRSLWLLNRILEKHCLSSRLKFSCSIYRKISNTSISNTALRLRYSLHLLLFSI